MTYILSNYGLRLLQNLQETSTESEQKTSLLQIKNKGIQTRENILLFDNLLKDNLIQANINDLKLDEVMLRYKRNPLEHLHRVTFEYTTLCNLSCSHCRNGNLVPVTERNLQSLKRTVDVVLPLGIRRFDFIGGEVLLYGMKWSELVRHIQGYSDQYDY